MTSVSAGPPTQPVGSAKCRSQGLYFREGRIRFTVWTVVPLIHLVWGRFPCLSPIYGS